MPMFWGTWPTRRHTPGDSTLHSNRCENTEHDPECTSGARPLWCVPNSTSSGSPCAPRVTLSWRGIEQGEVVALTVFVWRAWENHWRSTVACRNNTRSKMSFRYTVFTYKCIFKFVLYFYRYIKMGLLCYVNRFWLNYCAHIYVLTPQSRILCEKLTVRICLAHETRCMVCLQYCICFLYFLQINFFSLYWDSAVLRAGNVCKRTVH